MIRRLWEQIPPEEIQSILPIDSEQLKQIHQFLPEKPLSDIDWVYEETSKNFNDLETYFEAFLTYLSKSLKGKVSMEEIDQYGLKNKKPVKERFFIASYNTSDYPTDLKFTHLPHNEQLGIHAEFTLELKISYNGERWQIHSDCMLLKGPCFKESLFHLLTKTLAVREHNIDKLNDLAIITMFSYLSRGWVIGDTLLWEKIVHFLSTLEEWKLFELVNKITENHHKNSSTWFNLIFCNLLLIQNASGIPWDHSLYQQLRNDPGTSSLNMLFESFKDGTLPFEEAPAFLYLVGLNHLQYTVNSSTAFFILPRRHLDEVAFNFCWVVEEQKHFFYIPNLQNCNLDNLQSYLLEEERSLEQKRVLLQLFQQLTPSGESLEDTPLFFHFLPDPQSLQNFIKSLFRCGAKEFNFLLALQLSLMFLSKKEIVDDKMQRALLKYFPLLLKHTEESHRLIIIEALNKPLSLELSLPTSIEGTQEAWFKILSTSTNLYYKNYCLELLDLYDNSIADETLISIIGNFLPEYLEQAMTHFDSFYNDSLPFLKLLSTFISVIRLQEQQMESVLWVAGHLKNFLSKELSKAVLESESPLFLSNIVWCQNTVVSEPFLFCNNLLPLITPELEEREDLQTLLTALRELPPSSESCNAQWEILKHEFLKTPPDEYTQLLFQLFSFHFERGETLFCISCIGLAAERGLESLHTHLYQMLLKNTSTEIVFSLLQSTRRSEDRNRYVSYFINTLSLFNEEKKSKILSSLSPLIKPLLDSTKKLLIKKDYKKTLYWIEKLFTLSDTDIQDKLLTFIFKQTKESQGELFNTLLTHLLQSEKKEQQIAVDLFYPLITKWIETLRLHKKNVFDLYTLALNHPEASIIPAIQRLTFNYSCHYKRKGEYSDSILWLERLFHLLNQEDREQYRNDLQTLIDEASPSDLKDSSMENLLLLHPTPSLCLAFSEKIGDAGFLQFAVQTPLFWELSNTFTIPYACCQYLEANERPFYLFEAADSWETFLFQASQLQKLLEIAEEKGTPPVWLREQYVLMIQGSIPIIKKAPPGSPLFFEIQKMLAFLDPLLPPPETDGHTLIYISEVFLHFESYLKMIEVFRLAAFKDPLKLKAATFTTKNALLKAIRTENLEVLYAIKKLVSRTPVLSSRNEFGKVASSLYKRLITYETRETLSSNPLSYWYAIWQSIQGSPKTELVHLRSLFKLLTLEFDDVLNEKYIELLQLLFSENIKYFKLNTVDHSEENENIFAFTLEKQAPEDVKKQFELIAAIFLEESLNTVLKLFKERPFELKRTLSLVKFSLQFLFFDRERVLNKNPFEKIYNSFLCELIKALPQNEDVATQIDACMFLAGVFSTLKPENAPNFNISLRRKHLEKIFDFILDLATTPFSQATLLCSVTLAQELFWCFDENDTSLFNRYLEDMMFFMDMNKRSVEFGIFSKGLKFLRIQPLICSTVIMKNELYEKRAQHFDSEQIYLSNCKFYFSNLKRYSKLPNKQLSLLGQLATFQKLKKHIIESGTSSENKLDLFYETLSTLIGSIPIGKKALKEIEIFNENLEHNWMGNLIEVIFSEDHPSIFTFDEDPNLKEKKFALFSLLANGIYDLFILQDECDHLLNLHTYLKVFSKTPFSIVTNSSSLEFVYAHLIFLCNFSTEMYEQLIKEETKISERFCDDFVLSLWENILKFGEVTLKKKYHKEVKKRQKILVKQFLLNICKMKSTKNLRFKAYYTIFKYKAIESGFIKQIPQKYQNEKKKSKNKT